MSNSKVFLAATVVWTSWSFAGEHHHKREPTTQDSVAINGWLDETNAAMEKMRAQMAVRHTGDVDRDFVAMMAPHHQGAIDMALVYLRFGKNEPLRRLAQEIIVTQGQEIVSMKRAVGDVPPPAPPLGAR
ncbi:MULTISPECIES: DUF305 domain-containing protein [unclassified Rhizobium]|uniref:DUF305 domain-containing protein n=1 Tax=unclassified Rhizobium TaxID=2613769 RepID=UPI0016099343|nr:MULTISPECIES: DUF305 domain-containing protein [unclassified Rhizobium]MBB3545370.1 uncharacterized protein (DUF305 family) [Rhizobium sp. BK399]MCS4096306.1 uncharacterized protein (DUF305 family) [Rhizobium sp. BK176]